MRAREFLRKIFEQPKQDGDPILGLKNVIQHKIKDLPPTPETQHILDEINEILGTIPLGGKRKSLTGELATWKDQDVRDAKDLLAKYVASLESAPAYKKSMLEKWKTSGLINVTVMLDGRHKMSEIVMDYDSNPAIKELADDLIQVASLGHGKGEFFLKVLSPQISNPGPSGDILVRGFGDVEVKTTDGGAGRFTDRQVTVGPGFRNKSLKFIEKYSQYFQSAQPEISANTPNQQRKKVKPAPKPKKLGASGLNTTQLATIYQNLPNELKTDFSNELQSVLDEVFLKAPEYPGAIVNSILSGNLGQTKQLYGAGILKNYMNFKKSNKGILYIDIQSGPTFIFFTDNESLNASGLRIHTGTVYPVSTNDQYAFPQMEIQDTSQIQPRIS